VTAPDIVPTSGSTTAKSSGDHTPSGGFVSGNTTYLNSITPRVRIMSEHDRSRAATPKDLAEQFRELKILRAKVRQAEAKLSRKPGKEADLQQDRDLKRFTGATRPRTTTTKRG
jgi:hypothetical protein